MAKILFVEDDSFIAEIYIKKFEASGFEVVNVASGKAVLKKVQEDKFDIILLDMVIPEMSGQEVLRELRTNKEYDPNLKIVVFSNLSSSEDREEIMKLGANGFISKTEFSPSQVVDEVMRYLRQFGEQVKNSVREVEKNEGKSTSLQKRVLFIEDEAFFVDMFGKRLRDEGYEVVTKSEGTSGLQAATDEDFDVIISDIVMPGMSGDEIVTRIKESEKNKNVPIILLSASLEDEAVKAFETSGLVAKAFMKTEITPTELVEEINSLLK